MFCRKHVLSSLMLLLLFFSFSVLDVSAKSSSSGGGSRSSFSSSKSSSFSSSKSTASFASTSSSAKPSSAPASAPAKTSFSDNKSANVATNQAAASKPNTYGSSAPATASPTSTKSTFGGTSKFDANQSATLKNNASVAARQAQTAELNKFKTPVRTTTINKTDPIFNRAYVPKGGYNTYRSNRDTYYTTRNYTPPSYAYHGRSSYDGLDAIFLYSALSSMNNASMMSMMYNRSDTAAIKEWRKDAEETAKTNEELKEQLKELDAKLATMQGAKNPQYVPTDIPAAVMIAPEALEEIAPESESTNWFLYVFLFLLASACAVIFYIIKKVRAK